MKATKRDTDKLILGGYFLALLALHVLHHPTDASSLLGISANDKNIQAIEMPSSVAFLIGMFMATLGTFIFFSTPPEDSK